MAYSTQEAVSDGTLNLLSISIEYLDRSEISVYYDGVLNTTNWSWVGTTGSQIQFSPDVPTGTVVLVKRSTALSEVRHNFTGGAAFIYQTMHENFEQVLHVAQEAIEGSLGGDFYQDVDMHGHAIKNLAPAIDSTDALQYGQFQTAVVPYVNAAALSAANAESSAIDAAVSAANAESSAIDAAVSAANLPNATTAGASKFLRTNTGGTAWDYLSVAQMQTAINAAPADVVSSALGVSIQPFDADTAKTDVAQNFTQPQRSAILTDNDLSFDLGAKQNFKSTPTAGGVLTFTGLVDGLSGYIILVNGSNYAITKDSAVKCDSALLRTISATGTYVLSYLSDGTNVYLTTSGKLV